MVGTKHVGAEKERNMVGPKESVLVLWWHRLAGPKSLRRRHGVTGRVGLATSALKKATPLMTTMDRRGVCRRIRVVRAGPA